MGQSIDSVTHMLAYAGDLRRAAKVAAPDTGQKLAQGAEALERTALVRAGITNPNVGKLLDLIA